MTATTRAKRAPVSEEQQDTLLPIGVAAVVVGKPSIITKASPKVIFDARLLRVMRWVYQHYTGEQLAQVIGLIRAERDLEHEQLRLKQQILELEKKSNEISSNID